MWRKAFEFFDENKVKRAQQRVLPVSDSFAPRTARYQPRSAQLCRSAGARARSRLFRAGTRKAAGYAAQKRFRQQSRSAHETVRPQSKQQTRFCGVRASDAVAARVRRGACRAWSQRAIASQRNCTAKCRDTDGARKRQHTGAASFDSNQPFYGRCRSTKRFNFYLGLRGKSSPVWLLRNKADAIAPRTIV